MKAFLGGELCKKDLFIIGLLISYNSWEQVDEALASLYYLGFCGINCICYHLKHKGHNPLILLIFLVVCLIFSLKRFQHSLLIQHFCHLLNIFANPLWTWVRYALHDLLSFKTRICYVYLWMPPRKSIVPLSIFDIDDMPQVL